MIRAHIYRDIFGFISGPAEIELEAVGVGHPIPVPTEEKALLLLLGRATANTIECGGNTLHRQPATPGRASHLQPVQRSIGK